MCLGVRSIILVLTLLTCFVLHTWYFHLVLYDNVLLQAVTELEKGQSSGKWTSQQYMSERAHWEERKKAAWAHADHAESQAARAAALLTVLRRKFPTKVEGPAMEECRVLGPAKCKEHLGEAVGDKHTQVTTAIRLLRHGHAGSLCDQFGPSLCHEKLGDATDKGHRGVIAAIKSLQVCAISIW